MTNEPQNRDGLRDWIDYEGHVPQPYEGRHNLGRVGQFFANLLATEYRCPICDTVWPCVAAVARERDYAEAEATRRGDLLRAAGIPVDDAKPFHSDADTTLGRAIMACRDQILRRRCERAAQIATQQVNLYSWHPTCSQHCTGRNHVEVLLIATDCDERATQSQLIGSVLDSAYGVSYQSHEPLPPHQQGEAKREYQSRMFNARLSATDLVEDKTGAEGMTAYAVRFLSGAPLDTIRAFIADQHAVEASRDAGDKR